MVSLPKPKFSDAAVLAEINHRLEKHPGDAPWSCVECYHNRPCLDAQILRAAKLQLTKNHV